MFDGRVVCCRLVSDVEYAPRALLRLQKRRTDRRTDQRQTVTLRLPLVAASVITFKFEARLKKSEEYRLIQ